MGLSPGRFLALKGHGFSRADGPVRTRAALQAAEKLRDLSNFDEKRASVAKAGADVTGFTRGINPPSPSVLSFSAASLAAERMCAVKKIFPQEIKPSDFLRALAARLKPRPFKTGRLFQLAGIGSLLVLVPVFLPAQEVTLHVDVKRNRPERSDCWRPDARRLCGRRGWEAAGDRGLRAAVGAAVEPDAGHRHQRQRAQGPD